MGEALDVGIDDDAFVEVEGIAEDDIGRFAADAGEGDERVHVARDFAPCFATRSAQQARMFLALARKSPVDWMMDSSSAGSISA